MNGHASAAAVLAHPAAAHSLPSPPQAARPVDELLAEFTSSGSEAAFAEVVRRYAAMVFAVCLRVTKNAHDAEDATQATFLTLAVQCKSGKPVARLTAWLNQVAKRAALDVRRGRKRRENHEQRHAERARYDVESRLRADGRNGHLPHGASAAAASGGPGEIDFEKLNTVMAEELARLPAKYRLPLLSLYFGELTRPQIAAELGLTVATLGVRIHRGRQMLARRLSDRGVAPARRLLAGGMLAAAIATIARASLVERTAAAAGKIALGRDVVAVTTEGVLAALRGSAAASALAKLKVVAAVTVASLTGLTAATAGAGVVTADDLRALGQRLPQPVREVIRVLRSPWQSSPMPLPRPAQPPGFSPPIAATAPPTTPAPAGQNVVAPPPAYASNAHTGQPPATAAVEQPRPLPTYHSGGRPLRIAAAPGPSNVPAPRPQRAIPGAVAAAGAVRGQPVTVPLPATRDDAMRLPPRPAAAAPGQATSGYGGDGAYALTRDRRAGPGAGPGRQWDSLSVAPTKGSAGSFHIRKGVLNAGVQDIGRQGAGSVRQTRGWNMAFSLVLGAGAGGRGVYALDDGTMVVSHPPASAALHPGHARPKGPAARPAVAHGGIHVGGDGNGTLQLGGDGRGGGGMIIQQRGPNSPRPVSPATPGAPPTVPSPPSLVVRGDADGTGVIQGFGSAIGDGGTFVNNGQVIADARGQFRSLLFLGYSAVTSTIDNGPGGANGWFARGGGRLVLPKIDVAPGTHTYTWGENPLDPTLDLVNSARVTLRDAQSPAKLDISLMDKTRPEVPDLPAGHTFIGVWSMDTGMARPAGADLTVRYDDGLASRLGLNEAVLKLWRYDATTEKWTRINDGTFSRDTQNNLLSGHAEGPTTFFAVSAPEPSALGVLAIGGAALLRRRRA